MAPPGSPGGHDMADERVPLGKVHPGEKSLPEWARKRFDSYRTAFLAVQTFTNHILRSPSPEVEIRTMAPPRELGEAPILEVGTPVRARMAIEIPGIEEVEVVAHGVVVDNRGGSGPEFRYGVEIPGEPEGILSGTPVHVLAPPSYLEAIGEPTGHPVGNPLIEVGADVMVDKTIERKGYPPLRVGGRGVVEAHERDKGGRFLAYDVRMNIGGHVACTEGEVKQVGVRTHSDFAPILDPDHDPVPFPHHREHGA